ncbi:Rossmann-like and DUF2520 domain-containing protein [Azotosporobacter soli]|uniref:Rossmann-like and DUF2520 domain-containing protein n=1 Tax=Azotosporobacter soli TaxID=3055040 RepID=UPI0031FE830D
MTLTIAVIGAGKVGSALARALQISGCDIAAVFSRRRSCAERLAQEVGATVTNCAAEAAALADVVLLATPDAVIADVAEELRSAGCLREGQSVLHMAGALGGEPLASLAGGPASLGCLHPLQTFAGGEAKEAFQNVFFAIDGDPEACACAGRLVEMLDGRAFQLPETERSRYHAAACMVSNYLVVLVQWAVRRYGEFGLAEADALPALLPLIRGTVLNLQRVGTEKALTGPISRGDAATVAAHLAVLPDGLEREIYQVLGRGALAPLVEKQRLTTDVCKEIAGLLENQRRI